jgi:hypothetical protein
MQGYDTDAAELDYANASLGTARARLNEDYSQYGEKQVKQSLANMSSPLDENWQLYTDPVTRQMSWKSPADADQAQFDYQTSLARKRIPAQYQTSQQRDAYEAGVSPLAGATEAVLREFLQQDMRTSLDPSQAGSGAATSAVLQELIRRNHGNEQLARYQLGLLMDAVARQRALEQRQAAATAPGLAGLNTNGQ